MVDTATYFGFDYNNDYSLFLYIKSSGTMVCVNCDMEHLSLGVAKVVYYTCKAAARHWPISRQKSKQVLFN